MSSWPFRLLLLWLVHMLAAVLVSKVSWLHAQFQFFQCCTQITESCRIVALVSIPNVIASCRRADRLSILFRERKIMFLGLLS